MEEKVELTALFNDINGFFNNYQFHDRLNMFVKGRVRVYDSKLTSELVEDEAYKHWTKEINDKSPLSCWPEVRMILGMVQVTPRMRIEPLYQGWKPVISLTSMRVIEEHFKDKILDSVDKGRWAEVSQVEIWPTIKKSVQEVMGEADYETFIYEVGDDDPKPYPGEMFGGSFYFFYCEQKEILICMQFAVIVPPPGNAPTADVGPLAADVVPEAADARPRMWKTGTRRTGRTRRRMMRTRWTRMERTGMGRMRIRTYIPIQH